MGECTKPFTNCSNFSRYPRRGISSFFIYRKEQQNKEWDKIASQPKLIIEYHPFASPDTYCPARSFPGQITETEYRKFLRVAITNDGGGIAYQCKARLKILNDGPNFSPSLEPKILQWDSSSIYEDIGVGENNFSILDVVFSESRDFQGKRAFVSTPYNLNMFNSIDYYPHIEDGFHIGDYIFELVVTTIDGFSVRNVYKLHVTDNWDKISMEKID